MPPGVGAVHAAAEQGRAGREEKPAPPGGGAAEVLRARAASGRGKETPLLM